MMQVTGYPSIDKPWLSFYKEEAITAPIPNASIYEYIWEKNKNHLNEIAIRYFGNKISFKVMFSKIESVSNALISIGVKPKDVVAVCIALAVLEYRLLIQLLK